MLSLALCMVDVNGHIVDMFLALALPCVTVAFARAVLPTENITNVERGEKQSKSERLTVAAPSVRDALLGSLVIL